jgi:hypothetical protein
MRRLLTLLLLTLLTLPFSTVALADVVERQEVFQSSDHLSHHSLGSDSLSAQVDDRSGIDLDCSTCHVNCAAAVLGMSFHVFDREGKELLEFLGRHPLDLWHERPYRPKWPVLMGSGRPASA